MSPKFPFALRLDHPALRPLATALALALSHAPTTWATDISQTPLINSQVSVKPNLMFILDNSGSMGESHMPERLDNLSSPKMGGRYAYWSSQCNGMAYNPAITYDLPKTSDGRNYPAMSAAGAWKDGFQPEIDSNGARHDLDNLSLDTQTPDPATGAVLEFNVTVPSMIFWFWWGTVNQNFAVNDKVVLRKRYLDSVNNAYAVDPSQWMIGTVTSATVSGNNVTYRIRLTYASVRIGTHTRWELARYLTSDLAASSSTNKYYRYTGSLSPLGWTYGSDGKFDMTTAFAQECGASLDTLTNKFTKEELANLSDAQRTNYANWYSYYRTRMLMMRSSAGRAMFQLDNRYRVGFAALNRDSSYNSYVLDMLGVFGNIADFDPAQKVTFFSHLYSSPPNGGTPLRRTLAKVGRYYGNRISGQVDPIQSACQRNYALLTTDGYWNDDSDPVQLDGTTAIGNQDGDIGTTPRPRYDGSQNSVVTYQRKNYEFRDTSGCSGQRKRYREILETRTETNTPSGSTPGEWVFKEYTGDTIGCTSTVPQPGKETQVAMSGGPASNTLADVAAYYYNTDLRSNLPNSVPATDKDPNPAQHMTTYTLGLGVNGRLNSEGYTRGASADYNALVSGTLNWPVPDASSNSDPGKTDDLWHAAVNGRGQFFSAGNPASLEQSLTDALKDIQGRDGAGAAAASTSLRPVFGVDQVFIASYRTVSWNGELEARTIQVNNNVVSVSVENSAWRASPLLNARTHTDRTIYYRRKATATDGTISHSLGAFDWATLGTDTDATALRAHFNNYCSKTPRPTQCADLSSSDQTAASGENLVNFLRGERSRETTLYRKRESLLGDIVDASPVYVGKPPFGYSGAGYATFASDNAQRCPVVYVAANDGMLHAFSAKSSNSASSCVAAGREMWAYVPRAVMPKLYQLSDKDYANRHQFTVNATPVVGDVSRTVTSGGTSTTTWKTILVGGLGAGGSAYYALDISNPGSPATLWEFTDGDLGLTFGNPIITQVPDITGALRWSVVFTSGLNNSGNGFLYVLDAHTGALIHKVPTLVNGNAVGSASDPSGLGKLNVWVDAPSDNVATRFYAGDLLGNVWRFTADNLLDPALRTENVGRTPPFTDTRAVRLAQLKVGTQVQPITVRPELAEVQYGGARYPVVLVGTGRYLGSTDVLDTTSQQSVYAIKDKLETSGWTNARGSMVAQALSTNTAGDVRTITRNAVDWSSSTVAGWYVDLVDPGERVAVGMNLAYTTLTVASIVPDSNVCVGSGYSWIYDLDINNGSYVLDAISSQAGYKRPVATMGINTLQFEGRDKSGQIITNADGSTEVRDHVRAPTASGGMRRTMWRELTP